MACLVAALVQVYGQESVAEKAEALDVHEAHELLTAAADAQRTALEGIASWSGGAEITTTLYTSDVDIPNVGSGAGQNTSTHLVGEFEVLRTSMIRFDYDFSGGRFRSDYVIAAPTTYLRRPGGESVGRALFTDDRRTICQSGELLSFRPDELMSSIGTDSLPTVETPATRVVIREPTGTGARWSIGSDVFDANELFLWGGRRVDLLMRSYAEQLASSDTAHLISVARITSTGDLRVSKRFLIGNTDDTMDVALICDAHNQYLPAHAESVANGVTWEEVRWEWMRVGTVHVPSRYQIGKFTPEGVPIVRHDCVVTTSAVNAPIDEIQFTLEGLGAQAGDRVWDKVADKVTAIGGEPVSRVPSHRVADAGRWLWIVSVNAVVICVILLLSIRSRRRRPQ